MKTGDKFFGIIFIILNILCANINGQKNEITIGTYEKVSSAYVNIVNGKNGELIKLSTNDVTIESNVIVPKGKTSTIYVSKYDTKLNFIEKKEIELEQKKCKIESFVNIKGIIYLFLSKYDEKIKSIYVTTLNPSTLELTKGLKKIGSFDAKRESMQAKTEIKFSDDSTKIILLASSSEEKNEKKSFYANVMDSKLNKIWEKQFITIYTNKFFQHLDWNISNTGELCLAFKDYYKETTDEEIKENGKKIQSFKIKVMQYNGSGQETESSLEFGENFITDVQLYFNDKQEPHIFGLYKEDYESKLKGLFHTELIKNKAIDLNTKTFPFSNEIIRNVNNIVQNFLSNITGKGEGISKNFMIKDVVNINNTANLIIQDNYSKSSSSTNSSGQVTSTSTYFITGDIIVCRLKQNKEISFIRIPTHQSARNIFSLSSFYLTKTENKLVFMYTDKKENLEKNIDQAPEKVTYFNQESLIMATVDEYGKIDRKVILNNKDLKGVPHPTRFISLGNKKVVLYSISLPKPFKRFKEQLGVISMK